MAGKKDFSGITVPGKKTTKFSEAEVDIPVTVFDAIERGTTTKGIQATASPQEQADRKERLQTQGRKGCKAQRINLALRPSNHDFVRVIARATGRTMTEFINDVIEAYREEHPEYMEQAKGFIELVRSGEFSGKK